jgi:hypothetical protein
MPANTLSKAAVLTCLLVIVVIGSRELYLRSKGIPIAYDNDKELWADKRAMVYEPAGKTTVFIGSSRMKFDLDIDTWQKTTGRHAVQLAIEGSSPMPILTDLGNDPNFRGRLVVDMTEGLFYSTDKYNFLRPDRNLAWYKEQTPAQKASFALDHVLESGFVFLDKDYLSLNALLDQYKIPDREGVYTIPDFPLEFNCTTFDRQSKMADRFLADTSLQHQTQNVWLFCRATRQKAPPPKGDPVPPVIARAKEAVDKIRSRGGDVVFIRPPSSGPMLVGEQRAFPRERFWQPLLAATGCPGIHFADDPATVHFICPEWSHLSPPDAVLYTKALISRLPSSFTN